jgi:asparagine synthase (glutamine-hydrolysing)
MCGIAGVAGLDRPAEELRAAVAAMTDALVHRGPDDDGYWQDDRGLVGLGHRRLSILDLSDAGKQPMCSADGRYVLTYNGELYNFLALRHELEAAGFSFRGHSDSEVLVNAIAHWGFAEALTRFNGMFALAAWDNRDQQLLLARDRAGEKPLFMAHDGRRLAFASELKALLAAGLVQPTVDRDALALYLRHGWVPAPHTIFRSVWKLPPAHYVEASRQERFRPRVRSYWDLRTAIEAGEGQLAGPGEAMDQIEALLDDSVRIRLASDVPLGAFLSGGVDSSTIVALAQRHLGSTPLKTFTIGFLEQGFDEAEQAKQVAAHLGTDHHELYVRPQDAIDLIPELPRIYDEPFADSSQVPTVLLARLTRQSVTVSLSGDGGDELFTGYDRYVWGRFLRPLARLPQPVRGAFASAVHGRSAEGWDDLWQHMHVPQPFGGRPGDRLHKFAGLMAEASQAAIYRHLISHWSNPGDIVIGGSEPDTLLDRPTEWPVDRSFVEHMRYFDFMHYLPDDVLTKVDRATMSCGLEARVPMLDHRLVELLWRVPTSWNMRGLASKRLLRGVLARHVPPALTNKPKMGFSVPIGDWLRGPLRGWAEDLLHPRRLAKAGYLSPEPIRRAWQEHLAGTRDWKYHLWDILMFEAWRDEWLPAS